MLMPLMLFMIMAAVVVIRCWFELRAAVVRVMPAAAKKGVQQHHGEHGDCSKTSHHENTPGSDENDATGGFETGQSRLEAGTIMPDCNVQLPCQNELTPMASVFPRLSRARRRSAARNHAKNTRRVIAR